MKITNLNALRFFNSAASCGSFVKAAEELHVTHGAVSRQVRVLEESLGVVLFERRNRSVFLNASGTILYNVTNSIFEQLDSVVNQLKDENLNSEITLSCEPTIAMRWLIPRLHLFHKAYPKIRIKLISAGGAVDFNKNNIDIAIRRNDFYWDDSSIHSLKLCDEWMGPVSKPSSSMIDIKKIGCLLHPDTRPLAWKSWSNLSGVKIYSKLHMNYEHFYLCIQAAISGLGVTIASFLMVSDEISNGKLHSPYGFHRDGSSYHILSRAPIKNNPNVELFYLWLKGEIDNTLNEVLDNN